MKHIKVIIFYIVSNNFELLKDGNIEKTETDVSRAAWLKVVT